MKFIEITTTFENKEEAEKMAKLLLDERLVSCAQISKIDSLYHWKGKLEKEHEFMLTLKSKSILYKQIEKIIKKNHSYEVPQIVVLPIKNGSKEYLEWIKENII